MAALTRAGFLAASAATAVATPLTAANGQVQSRKPYYALVLSGGGAYGAYEAGVLSRLDGMGVEYDVVCGTSIGALNGAMYASAQVPRVIELWRTLHERTVVALPADVRPTPSTAVLSRVFALPHRVIQSALGRVQGVFAAQPVRDVIRDMLVTPDGTRVVPFQRRFFWAVTDLSDLCGTFFYHGRDESGPVAETLRAAFRQRGARLTTTEPRDPNTFVEALRASSAIPAFFEPARLAGRLLVDGGVGNNTPFDVAKIARGLFGPGRPLEIHVVFTGPSERRVREPDVRNALAILLTCYDVMQKRLVDDAARLTVREAALAAQRAAAAPATVDERIRSAADVTIRAVRPAHDLQGSVYDFTDQAAIDANFALGARDIERGWQPYVIPAEFCRLGETG